jgi:hypothetical protein
MKSSEKLSVYISSENRGFCPKFSEAGLIPAIAEVRGDPVVSGWEVMREKSENIRQQDTKCLSQDSEYPVEKRLHNLQLFTLFLMF